MCPLLILLPATSSAEYFFFLFSAIFLGGFKSLSIYQNRDFITIYHGEQEGPNDFDTVLLKALVGGRYMFFCFLFFKF